MLMPPTGPHAHGPGGHVEPHLARLIYDTAFERPGATRPDFHPRYVPLEDGTLDLAGLPTRSGLDLTLPDEVVDLTPVVREKIKRERLHSDTSGRVLSRITAAAGSVSAHNQGARWHLAGAKPQHMSTVVQWTIRGIQGNELGWELAGLNRHSGRALPTLHPINGIIQVFVYHAPPEEIPPSQPARNVLELESPAEHFAAYYNLFDQPAATPLPRYRDSGSMTLWTMAHARTVSTPFALASHSADGPAQESESLTADTPTCLTARASLE